MKKREPGKEAQLLRMQSWKPLDATDPLPALSELFNDAKCSLYSLSAGTTTGCQTKPKCHISNQAVDHHLRRLVVLLLKAILQSIVSCQVCPHSPWYYINPCIIATTLESRILLRTFWMNSEHPIYAPYICNAMSKNLKSKMPFSLLPPISQTKSYESYLLA